MSKDSSSRFGHLLQPIRDLSKVWKIEIAEELEKYIEEVGQLPASDPGQHGASSLNFAEAALLVQGSTAIYSRKVELLYQLVYQALDLMPAQENKDPSKKKLQTSQHHAGLWAPIPETEKLLTIGHLVKEGRNTLLDRTVPPQRQAQQYRVPLFLLPRDDSGVGAKRSISEESVEGLDAGMAGQKECRLGSCTVHQSGAFLLQESDAKLLDRMVDGKEDWGMVAGGPLVPTPPREVEDLETRLQEILRGEQAGAEADLLDVELEAPPGAPESPAPVTPPPRSSLSPQADGPGLDDGNFGTLVADDGLPFGEGGAGRNSVGGRRSSDEFWAPLDEHASLGSDIPLQVGKTSRFPAAIAKHLMVPLDQLPPRTVPSAEDLRENDKETWKRGEGEKVLAQHMANGSPVDALFLAALLQGRVPGPKPEVLKAGFSAAWIEFENLFAKVATKATSQRRTNPKEKSSKDVLDSSVPGGAVAPGEGGADRDGFGVDEAMVDTNFDPGELGVPGLEGSSSQLVPTPDKTPATDLGLSPLQDLEELARQDRREEVVRLESMIEDAQARYEATIRQHLQSLGKDGIGDNRYGQLYANVKRWQDQLAPVLREFNSRPEFDIQDYSANFLTDIQHPSGQDENADPEAENHRPTVKFSRLVEGRPRWEVCRRFLTCLFLTNHGNTEIVTGPTATSLPSPSDPGTPSSSSRTDEMPGDFLVRLVKADCNSISLDMDEEAEAPRGQRRARQPLAPLQEHNVPAPAPAGLAKGPARKRARRAL